ncbi:MAG: amino acid adenylation domain-containing protein [Verrucomicrobiae bacterium]|nr:amino acid adenylation domain-containing protein [Verrucomicrobiae bacterium]NNJ42361.1 amino acid adenylation domain-containing protein [Akkermansiaceae bacterium]
MPEDERCRVVLIGDASIGMHCLRSLRTAGHEVVACLANGKSFAASARREGVMTYDPGTPLAVITKIPCDWIVSAYNVRLIPAEILRHPVKGSINFHDAPLPRYAGLYAPTRALLDGETEYAVTWHMVEEGIDTGGIIIQTPVPIHDDDTSQSLNLRCLEAGARGFDMIVLKLGRGPMPLRQQELSERTYFGNSDWPRGGMEINWQWPAHRIQRVVRALDFGPFPNYVGCARFRLDREWYRLINAEVCCDQQCPSQNAQPGTISIASDARVHIATSKDCLVATSLAPSIVPEASSQTRHAELKQPDELAQIARWEEGVFRFEWGWRRQIQKCSEDPEDTKSTAVLSRGSSTVDLGTTDHDLACGLLAWALSLGEAHIEVGRWWTEKELNDVVGSAGDPAVIALLNRVAPIVVEVDEGLSILAFVEKWLELVMGAQRRGPFFADLLERGGRGEAPMPDPASRPIQLFPEDVGAVSVGVSSWQIQRENGRWLARGASDMTHVGNLAKRLRELIIDQPATRISDLPRLAPATELLVREWENGGCFDSAPRSFLASIFSDFTRRQSSKAIETAVGQIWTYGNLGREVAWLMARLGEAGVEQGDMVPVRLGRSPELIAAQLAVMGLGCAFVPISEEDPDLRVLDVLERTCARVAIGQALKETSATIWLQPRCDHDDPDFELPCEPDASLVGGIACVFFTSGSTGRPKGVKITHRGLDAYIEDSTRYFGRESFQRSLWTSSVAFDSTLAEVMTPLAAGGCVVIPRPESVWSVRGLVESLSFYNITYLGMATALWSVWMRDAQHVANPIPSSLRAVDVGGGVLSPELVKQWQSLAVQSIRLCNGYGPTEATVICTHYDIGRESLSFPSIPIGAPNKGAMIRVLDEQGRRVAPGIVGEIVIGGLGVADGYLDDPEETLAQFVKFTDDEGWWYRSGDLGSWTDNGELLFHGRADEQLKIHGYRVEPEEICRAIRNLSGVKDAEVMAFETKASKELGAVVIRMAESCLGVDENSRANLGISDQDWTMGLQNQLEKQLPRYAVPRRWLLVTEWSRTATGKVNRVELASRFSSASQQSDRAEPIDPRDTESVLQFIRNFLARPSAEPSESFFELGGDSLAAMGLQLKLEAAVGRSLPLSLVYGSKTIAAIAEGVANEADGKEAPSWSSLVPLQPKGSKEALFLVHGVGGNVYGFIELAKGLAPDQPVYGIQAVGLDGDSNRHISVEEMAAHYVEEIRSFQPEGPYYLGGYSMGGWLAYEVAQQLDSLGQRVAVLALFDSSSIGVVPWAKFLQIKAPHYCRRIGIHLTRWWKMPNQERCNYILGRGKAFLRALAENRAQPVVVTDRPQQDNRPPKVDGFIDYYHAVASSYQMDQYSGRVDLFASDCMDPHAISFWKHFARGKFNIHRIPGRHNEIMLPEHLPVLTQSLRGVLDQAQGMGNDKRSAN